MMSFVETLFSPTPPNDLFLYIDDIKQIAEWKEKFSDVRNRIWTCCVNVIFTWGGLIDEHSKLEDFVTFG